MAFRRNERDWAGQLISWLKAAIENHATIFQDVTNDTSIKADKGRTKFPDVLLFIDKTSGVVFNGWELKFPDTPVDDIAMLRNALEKAKILNSGSFVTWNGSEAVIWGIDKNFYSVGTLSRIKEYPKISMINTREDLALPSRYSMHEIALKERALEILHDLEQLYLNGYLKPAINISENISAAICAAGNIIIPQFHRAITDEKGINRWFRAEFGRWKIYEGSTLRILQTSSRRKATVQPEEVLAKFTFYNLVGKILFYLTLSENTSGRLEPIVISEKRDIKLLLEYYFDQAKKIDYQAIFKPYFTDCLKFSSLVNDTLAELLRVLMQFDFRILPVEVIGTILENLVPAEEKQKFGQYFTPPTLADLVAFPVVQTRNDFLLDPTSGTGTFLNSFYRILGFYGNNNHISLLNQIWGNDVSHFPAILSVINLYKNSLSETGNFPRVMRDDFFNLEVGQKIDFPDSFDHAKRNEVALPLFDGIASNFPFIQQEDIPNEHLTAFFQDKFGTSQKAFMRNGSFKINERSDYFTYCIYNSVRFLRPKGCLAAITSNAWLGKEYGLQFKKFLLDNFHIKYVVKSSAEHWFKNSQVSTVFVVLERENVDSPTRFVTVNKRLDEYLSHDDCHLRLRQIENFYIEIDNCENSRNINWVKDATLKNRYTKSDGSIDVCVVSKKTLDGSIEIGCNWDEYFLSSDMFGDFRHVLIPYFPKIIDVFRGERTGWNDMFVVKCNDIEATGIPEKFLVPYVKSASELTNIEHGDNCRANLFVCQEDLSVIDENTRAWIGKFQNVQNKNGSKTIKEACSSHSPYWYSLQPKLAQIVTAINPYSRFFFTYSKSPFAIDQRLIAIRVNDGYDVELIAALLNSALTFLVLEMQGTSRNLGALDLNANYLKQVSLLNPELLTKQQTKEILETFEPLKKRPIGNIIDEIKMPDRIEFDRKVFECYGFGADLLNAVYRLLETTVSIRISMRDK